MRPVKSSPGMRSIDLFLSALLTLVLPLAAIGQELNATVVISTPKLQEADPVIFKTLEKDLREFINQERWGNVEFKSHEKIECNFQVNIKTELGNNAYQADIAIKAVRPVYGSEYKTLLINYVDRDIIFNYQEYQPIENSTNFFRDNLSAVFSFYAHLILGLDGDSFTPVGGDEHYRFAQQIINQIPSAIADIDKGWQSLNRKNTRYWMMENLLSARFVSYREAWYNYHRKSLDVMHANSGEGVATMIEALKEVDKTNTTYPLTVTVIMFVSCKSDEIIEIMKNADRTQKNAVYDIMRKLDPSNSGKYNALRQ